MIKRGPDKKLKDRKYSVLQCLVGLSIAIIVAISAWLFFLPAAARTRSASQSNTLAAARAALQQGKFEVAIATCQSLLAAGDDRPAVLLVAGEAASKRSAYADALTFYDRIPGSAGRDAAIARWAAGEVTLQMGRVSDTLSRLQQALALDPSIDKARDRLIDLLNVTGRRWEAVPHLFELLKQDRWSIQHLMYLGNLSKSIENENELQRFLKLTPSDLMPNLGLARIRLRHGEYQATEQLLTELSRQAPDVAEVHVQFGKLWLQIDPSRLQHWHDQLPTSADQHPDIWFVRGQWLRLDDQHESAARCYAEALSRDPDHLPALNALAQILNSMGQADRAEALLARAQKLEKLLFTIERVMADEWAARQSPPASRRAPSIEPIVTAAQLTLDLGRAWEAHAWSRYGLAIAPQHSALQQLAVNSQSQLSPSAPRCLKIVVEPSWIASLKSPTWPVSHTANANPNPNPNTNADANANKSINASVSDTPARSPAIRFTQIDSALDFRYFAARTSFEDGRRMFEFTGGGAGVLDYDRDGWPDIFLAQGCSWPPPNDSHQAADASRTDRLKRNILAGSTGDSIFIDVTESARIAEHAFGQGVAVGDIDCDGFDDVYVCNFGVNQLWLNQGDGTFRNGSAFFVSRFIPSGR